MAILDQVLHGGRAGRIYRNLVLEKQVAVDTEGGIHYPMGDIFDYNGPTQMVTRILHKPEVSPEQTIALFDEAIRELQENRIETGEIEPVKVKFKSDYFSMLEGGRRGPMPRYGLMHLLACFTLFDNEPQLVNTILDGFLEVTPAQVQAVAQKYMQTKRRAIVIRQPASTRGTLQGAA
jgi:predicted Zn-dependent peptidase